MIIESIQSRLLVAALRKNSDMADELDWHETALNVYRNGKLELETSKRLHRNDLEYWLEEVEEALLDLKQATIAEESARAMDYAQEVVVLLFELRRRK